ncbi:motility protein A [Roseburia intestinalis]|uniref:motility protein A n=1 Tax=Roseburia intestinalis TaxID=166486 RepID=UPI00243340B7|nr:MotA/TolQ/ExbB proton channel family protein [Roseburia intestinalis]
MDIASIVGMLLGVVMFVFGVLSNGGVASLHSMWDTASFIITIGGSIAGTLASFKLADFINGIKSIKLIFKDEVQDPAVVINQIISLSNTARKEGLLALEEAANGIEDDFLKKGIMLVVDGTDPELVRGIMETDLACVESRHKAKIAVWEKWAELGVTVHSYLVPVTDFADASHSKSAKSAATTVSYGIFSSENACL